MKRGRIGTRALAFCLASGLSLNAAAQDHVVSRGQVKEALEAVQDKRDAGLAAIDRLLESPAAKEAAASLGVDMPRLRRSLAALDDAEVEELAARAAALSSDPVAGQSQSAPQAPSNPARFLTVILVLLGVVLVLYLVSGGTD